jgi:hypothetical protein
MEGGVLDQLTIYRAVQANQFISGTRPAQKIGAANILKNRPFA